MEKGKFLKNSTILKAAAAVAAVAVIAAVSLIPAKEAAVETIDPEVLNPNPVVMTLEEAEDAVVEEDAAEEEEKKQKLGFFTKLKLAFYAFCAACGAWFAHKIPWKKIFNKWTLIIVLLLAAVGVLVYHVGLPALTEYLKEVM